MGATFNGTTQYVRIQSLLTSIQQSGAGLIMGCWFRPSSGNGSMLSVTDFSSGTGVVSIMMASGSLGVAVESGQTFSGGSTPVSGAWNFAMLRSTNAADKRLHGINADGGISNILTTASPVASSFDNFGIGANIFSPVASFFGGGIAEAWMAFGDCGFNTSADIDTPMLKQIAYGGPYSVPQIAGNIVFYNSFRKGVVARRAECMKGDTLLTRTTSATIAPMGTHPNLPYYFRRPREDIIQEGMIQ